MSRARALQAGRFPASIVSWLLPLIVVAILAVMAMIEPRFYGRLNVANILRNFTVTSLLAIGQALVIIVGGFDLSVGAMMAAASVVAAASMVAMTGAGPITVIVIGIMAALLVGGALGVVNGVLVARMRASPFIVTLGTMTVLSGAVFYFTKATPIYGMPDELVSAVGRGRLLGLPAVFWGGMVVAMLISWIMAQSALGRHIYAVGSNPVAARESGISPARIQMIVYGLSGCLAAAAGIVLTARLGAGQSGIGGEAAIESIAAAVIAGVSLRGGEGSIPRVLMAALFLALIANVLNLLKIDAKLQTMVLGLFLIGFAALERRLHRNG